MSSAITATTTKATKSCLKSDYLQPSLSNSYDPNQSPLALLAQTCSSIGKDCPSSASSLSNIVPPILTTLPRKSSSNLSNLDKSSSLTRHTSPSHVNTVNVHKKSSHPLKTNILSSSPSFVASNQLSNSLTTLFDPTKSIAALLLRSSLDYLNSQQLSYSTACTIPGCLQCETVRYVLANSINNQLYTCHWTSCNARFNSNDELVEHIRNSHRSPKISFHSYPHRFHPYLNVSRMINTTDQLPFFYPHLSLTPMTESKRYMNNNTNNNN